MINRRYLFTIFLAAIPLASRAGAWGEGSFDNDDALDWVNDCVRSKSANFVLTTLKEATAGRYLEAPTASAAIAAAEVVAWSKGRPTVKLPPELQAWIKTQRKDSIAAFSPVAVQALERILSTKGSELRDLWRASNGFSTWESLVKGLLERVR
nr:hypothetical protein [uncultured bacterium]